MEVRWASALVTEPFLQAHLEQHIQPLLTMLDLGLSWSSTLFHGEFRLCAPVR